MTTHARTRQPVLDAQCAAAVDLARAAAEELAGAAGVGEHVGVVAEADRVATHVFTCLLPGYRGWEWSVTVARASRSREVTVSESVLLPGDDALLAPAWVPYAERIQPGDLSIGEILPTAPGDPRLEPGFFSAGDETDTGGSGSSGGADGADLDPVGLVAYELGLGRARVLSLHGQDEATTRWYEGDRGPTAPVALAAPGQCSTCGYLVPLAGRLQAVFGVCANEWSPSDSRVVSYDHGCGAHSEATVEQPDRVAGDTVVDTFSFDPLLDEDAEPVDADEVVGTSDVTTVVEVVSSADVEAVVEIVSPAEVETVVEVDEPAQVETVVEVDEPAEPMPAEPTPSEPADDARSG